jgi:uncharacterized membrane protein
MVAASVAYWLSIACLAGIAVAAIFDQSPYSKGLLIGPLVLILISPLVLGAILLAERRKAGRTVLSVYVLIWTGIVVAAALKFSEAPPSPLLTVPTIGLIVATVLSWLPTSRPFFQRG